MAQREIEGKFSKIEQPRQFETSPINPLVFGAHGRMIHDFTQDLQRWLTYPYIEDSFGKDHTARRNWRRSFKQYGEVGQRLLEPWLKNKYRANILSGPHALVDTLILVLESGGPEEHSLAEELETIWDPQGTLAKMERYPELELEEKKAIAEEMEDKVVQVLQAISRASIELGGLAK